jgi:aryl-alcohol dehydrogenase-like predicted oxidoreductase
VLIWEKVIDLEKKKLILGTANLESKYGVAQRNYLEKEEFRKILKKILGDANIYIDTAETYGNAEEIIGELAPQQLSGRVITKMVLTEEDTESTLIKRVETALIRLKQTDLASLLIHNPEYLNHANGKFLSMGLQEILSMGLARHVGISCYNQHEILASKLQFPFLTMFQLHENVVNRKNYNNKNLKSLKDEGNLIYVRSIFLQGLLLLDSKDIPTQLKDLVPVLEEVNDYCKSRNMSKLKYCLDYAESIDWASGIIVGVKSFSEFKAIEDERKSNIKCKEFTTKCLSDFDSDPRNWNM